MDKNTKELGEKLLHSLHETNQLLRRISEPGEQDVETHSQSDDSKDKDATVKRKISISPNDRPSSQNKEKTKNGWHDGVKRWKPTIEAIGIVFAIAYAWITFFQWRDSNRNFAVDERAWVSMEAKLTKFDFSPNGVRVDADFELFNSGKTPALNVTESAFIEQMGGPHWGVSDPIQRNCGPLYRTYTDALRVSSVIFPSKQFVETQGAAMLPKDLQQAISTSMVPNGVILVLYTCIDYTIDDRKETHHQTGQSYIFGYMDPARPGGMVSDFHPNKTYPDVKMMRLGQSFGN